MSDHDREISRGIVVNADRCGGKPTVKGTRITVEWLERLLTGPSPVPSEKIIEDYPQLSYHDLANVRGWIKRRKRHGG